MNIFIAVVCVNIITLVNAAYNINYNTVLTILKNKPRIDNLSRLKNAIHRIEVMPLTPKQVSTSLFATPNIRPEDQFEILKNTRNYNTREQVLKDWYLQKYLKKGNINANKNYGNDYRYDKEEERNQNTEVLLKKIFNTIQNSNKDRLNNIQHSPKILIFLSPRKDDRPVIESPSQYYTRPSSYEEIEDEPSEKNPYTKHNYHHMHGDHMHLHPRRSQQVICSGESEDESDSGSIEKNPGNPYTIHKNKYKQNWPYNHFMDGDHMNINPFGPQFTNIGPTGPELFFGRKWWYFNQDDYKPIGR